MSHGPGSRRCAPATEQRWVGAATAACLLLGLASGLQAEPCLVSQEQSGIRFPVEQLSPAALCLIEPIVNHATTSGPVGPITTPIPPALYGYLLDHPVVVASLIARLGLGPYQFTVKGPNQFWGNDGDGTQGLLTLLYRDQNTRLYHIDGYHEGRLFPMVRAKAVVLLRTRPVTTPEGRPAVETSLVAYTKLNNPVLSVLLTLLRPLIGDAVSRKLAKGFDATAQLGLVIANDPERVIQETRLLPVQPEDQIQLVSLLRGLPQPARAPIP